MIMTSRKCQYNYLVKISSLRGNTLQITKSVFFKCPFVDNFFQIPILVFIKVRKISKNHPLRYYVNDKS